MTNTQAAARLPLKDREVWQLTPKQFALVTFFRILSENGLNPKSRSDRDDARACVALQLHEYYRALYTASAAGNRVPDKVMDRIGTDARYRLTHDFPDLYVGYMSPDVRKSQEKFRAEYRGLKVRGELMGNE